MKDKEFEEIDAMLQEKYPILWRPHFDENTISSMMSTRFIRTGDSRGYQ